MSIQFCKNLKFEFKPIGSHHKFIMEATPLQLKQQFGILGIIRDTKDANNTILNSIEGLQKALKNVQAAHEVLSVYLNEEQHIKEQLKKALDATYDLMSQLELSDDNEGLVDVLNQEIYNPLSEVYHTMEGNWPETVPKGHYRLKKEEIIDPEVILFQSSSEPEEEEEDPELKALDEEFDKAFEEQLEEEEELEEEDEEEQEPEEQPKELQKGRKLPFSCLILKRGVSKYDRRAYLRYRRLYDEVCSNLRLLQNIESVDFGEVLKWLNKRAANRTKLLEYITQAIEAIETVKKQKNKWTRPFTLNQVVRAMTAMKLIVEMTQ